MHTTLIHWEHPDKQAHAPHQLVWVVGTHGLQWAVLTAGQQPLVWHAVTCDQASDLLALLNSWWTASPHLRAHFAAVHVFYTHHDTLLVPAALKDLQDPKETLNELFGDRLDQVDSIQDVWEDPNARLFYRIPSEIQAWFDTHFPSHVQAHALTSLFGKKRVDGASVVLLPGLALIALQKEGALQLAQVFPYTQPEDLTWYLLQAAQSFGCSPESMPVQIDGFVTEDAAVFEHLTKYIRNIQLQVQVPKPADQLPDQLPAQYFSPLFNMIA